MAFDMASERVTESIIWDGRLLSTETEVGRPIHREVQVRRLQACLRPIFRGERPVNAWLYGPPGSGKTAVARWVAGQVCSGGGPRTWAEVSCWEHRTLYSVAQGIVDELKVLGAETQDTNVKLDRIRQALRGRPAVFILDEIDRPMPAQREEIIRGLLAVPLVGLVCIARDTRALASLDEGVRSRLSPVLVPFRPYIANELQQILFDRARQGLAPESWTPALLERIGAGAGGDARAAIEILRQAAAAAEAAGRDRIDERLVEVAISQRQGLDFQARLARLSEHEQVIARLALRYAPLGTTQLRRLYQDHCRRHDIQPMARRAFSKYLSRLSAAGVVAVGTQSPGRGGRVVQAA